MKTIAQNKFDFWAGGKAAYEAFHQQYLQERTPYKPWKSLTLAQQKRWFAIAKAATKAALETATAKDERLSRIPPPRTGEGSSGDTPA